ncbi:MAG: response regulator [Elusimicrobiota bacterium]
MSTPIKILIVDDEKETTDMLVRYFKLENYDATACNTPIEALNLIKNDNFLVCILDIQMPEMNGIDLLKKIKQINGMTGVIMMSDHASTENILTCLRRGAETCFLKPISDLSELKKIVDTLIKRFKTWQKLIQKLTNQSKNS